MKVKVLPYQSLADIAVRYTGSVENLYEIAVANGLTLDAELVPGTEIEIPDELEMDAAVVRGYENNRLEPASALTADSVLGGIDYMGIQIDFWVR